MGVETEEEHVGPPIPMATDTSDQTPDDGPPAPKKRKAVNANELNLLENLPAADRYEKSYMHRKWFHFLHFITIMKNWVRSILYELCK